MADCVAIAPELPFRAQIVELATHLSRCLPSANDATASREFVTGFEGQLKDGEEEDAGRRKEVVKAIVAKVGEFRGALEGLKESDVESSHLLLQYVLSSQLSGEEYDQAYRAVLEAIKKGVEAYASTTRITRLEVAARILNNSYNSLPASSPLRPPTLLALLNTLTKFTELSILPLTPLQLSTAVNEWSTSSSEKTAFLSAAADIYRSAGIYSTSYELLLIALRYEVTAETVGKAVVVGILDDRRFSFDSLTGVQGVEAAAGTEVKALLALLRQGEVGVKAGSEWAQKNASWISSRGVSSFDAEAVLRKLRLLSLATLCARSSRTLSYADIASALSIPTEEVEVWVVDSIHSEILQARISQPSQTIRILSVSSAAERSFGSEQWELLEKRLGEWKVAVSDARAVIGEAEQLASQGPSVQGQGSGQQGGQRRYVPNNAGQRRGQDGPAQREAPREEVAAQ